MESEIIKFLACSNCFRDEGLRLDAFRIGVSINTRCPNCGDNEGVKLDKDGLVLLAHIFYELGSYLRTEFGGAPRLKISDCNSSPELMNTFPDFRLISELTGITLFEYGPNLWMIGEVYPLQNLLSINDRDEVVDRILREYPEKIIDETCIFYRIRINPAAPGNAEEYDSAPQNFLGYGRFDSKEFPILYCSTEIQICLHECRVKADDDIYVATLSARRPLRMLDLSVVLLENVTPFESLDMAVYMLFMASGRAYEALRYIALKAKEFGYDGIIYPSYFSSLRLGVEPFRISYGIPHRRVESLKSVEESLSIPNSAIFGRPIFDGVVNVICINRLHLERVRYDYHFGPVDCGRVFDLELI